ncbi:MAG: hypothetical protein RJA22_1456 [Verrucomicrobiota bacterium]|jgi:hypothetical protein
MPLQDFIHKVTEGSGHRFLQGVLVLFAMVGLAVWYDAAALKNLSTIEGMDAAQVGRNLAEGHGFSTQFVRPFSMRLLREHQKDPGLNGWHPDLAHPPLYPLLLAAALKVSPFAWPNYSAPGHPERVFGLFLPDLWLAMVNQLLFFIAVWLVFRLGRRLFDDAVAWVAAAVLAGAEVFWRFSASGQSTLLLLVLFLLLVEVLARLEQGVRAAEGEARSAAWLFGLAALAGLLAGLAGLTRYGFAWVMVPVGFWLGLLPTPRRATVVVVASLAFLATLAPWVARNYLVSGTPFGVAGYAVFQGTPLFPDLQLERTLNADFSLMTGGLLWEKLWTGLRDIVEKDIPRLGGSWVSAFFLVGLLVPFRNPVLGRLRTFVVLTLVTLAVAQALGRTGLSVESPEITTENLLVVAAPVVFLFGVSLFFMLLEQFGAAMPSFRIMAVGVFLALASLPLLLTLLNPVSSRLSYPPYYPAYIQEKAEWVDRDGLIMTDFPWAVAWYGRRQAVWLSLKFRDEPTIKWRNDFAALNELGKPIRALYLSARTLKTVDSAVLQPWILRQATGEDWESYAQDWESFVLLGAFLFREVPTGFPLKRPVFGLLPELFLSDSERPAEKGIQSR